jgi:hypothetical protein
VGAKVKEEVKHKNTTLVDLSVPIVLIFSLGGQKTQTFFS